MSIGATEINTTESEFSLPDEGSTSENSPGDELLRDKLARDELARDERLQDEVAPDSSGFDDELHSGAVDRKNPDRSLLLARTAALTAAEHDGTEIVVLDMTERTALFDYFVIATGTSRRQLHAMSEEIDHALEDKLNDKRMNIDGYDESRWIVLDYGTVVVHLFDEDTRAFYSLEALWSDAPKLDLTAELRESKK